MHSKSTYSALTWKSSNSEKQLEPTPWTLVFLQTLLINSQTFVSRTCIPLFQLDIQREFDSNLQHIGPRNSSPSLQKRSFVAHLWIFSKMHIFAQHLSSVSFRTCIFYPSVLNETCWAGGLVIIQVVLLCPKCGFHLLHTACWRVAAVISHCSRPVFTRQVCEITLQTLKISCTDYRLWSIRDSEGALMGRGKNWQQDMSDIMGQCYQRVLFWSGQPFTDHSDVFMVQHGLKSKDFYSCRHFIWWQLILNPDNTFRLDA